MRLRSGSSNRKSLVASLFGEVEFPVQGLHLPRTKRPSSRSSGTSIDIWRQTASQWFRLASSIVPKMCVFLPAFANAGWDTFDLIERDGRRMRHCEVEVARSRHELIRETYPGTRWRRGRSSLLRLCEQELFLLPPRAQLV